MIAYSGGPAVAERMICRIAVHIERRKQTCIYLENIWASLLHPNTHVVPEPTTTNKKKASKTGPTVKDDVFFPRESGTLPRRRMFPWNFLLLILIWRFETGCAYDIYKTPKEKESRIHKTESISSSNNNNNALFFFTAGPLTILFLEKSRLVPLLL